MDRVVPRKTREWETQNSNPRPKDQLPAQLLVNPRTRGFASVAVTHSSAPGHPVGITTGFGNHQGSPSGQRGSGERSWRRLS